MNKTIKWILIAVGALAGILIITVLCLPLFIKPNDFKDKITQTVQEQTGRELAIPGDIQLDISLAGLKTVFSLGDVTLSSSKNFPDTEFLSSRLVEIDLALWPLIKNKELKINKIILEGVNLNLVRTKDGTGNWDDLAGGGPQEQPAAPAEKKATAAGEEGKGLAGFDIGGIQAKDINVTLDDKQAGRLVKLSKFNLDIGHFQEGRSFPLKTDFVLELKDAKQDKLSATIATASNFTLFIADKHFVVDGFEFKGSLQGTAIPSGKLDVELAADIDIDLPGEKIEVKRLVVKQGVMQIETALTMAGLASPQVNGSVNIPQFSPRSQAESLGIALPLENPESLTSMSAEIDFAMDFSQVQLKKITLNFDDTTIDGTASLNNFLQPVYDLAIHVDQLDLDRYAMQKPGETDAGPEGEKSPVPMQEKEGDRPIIPVDMLRRLGMNADITIDKLRAAKLDIANITLMATGKNGLVKIEPFTADLYDGSITMTADIDANKDIPTMHIVKHLKGIQLGPLVKDMTGKEEIKGKADINADVNTKGLSKNDLTRNANGTLTLSLADGEIAKLKIIDTIRTAKALLGSNEKKDEKQTPGTNKDSGRPTTFASLTATGVITNGVFRNDDLLAESELMKVTGKGTVDLAREQIDYLLTVYLAKYLERNEETGLVDLTDTPIPYRVKGTFDKLEQSAAIEELVKSEAKKVLIKEIEKQFGSGDKTKDGTKKESSDSTQDLINKGLKGLFGN